MDSGNNPEQRLGALGSLLPALGTEINETLQDLAVWEQPCCFQL